MICKVFAQCIPGKIPLSRYFFHVTQKLISYMPFIPRAYYS